MNLYVVELLATDKNGVITQGQVGIECDNEAIAALGAMQTLTDLGWDVIGVIEVRTINAFERYLLGVDNG